MSWLALLPYLLQLIGWMFDRYGANQATKQAFLDLISRSKEDPIIGLRLKNDFRDMEEELKNGGGL